MSGSGPGSRTRSKTRPRPIVGQEPRSNVAKSSLSSTDERTPPNVGFGMYCAMLANKLKAQGLLRTEGALSSSLMDILRRLEQQDPRWKELGPNWTGWDEELVRRRLHLAEWTLVWITLGYHMEPGMIDHGWSRQQYDVLAHLDLDPDASTGCQQTNRQPTGSEIGQETENGSGTVQREERCPRSETYDVHELAKRAPGHQQIGSDGLHRTPDSSTNQQGGTRDAIWDENPVEWDGRLLNWP